MKGPLMLTMMRCAARTCLLQLWTGDSEKHTNYSGARLIQIFVRLEQQKSGGWSFL